jgi:hypothetical protein
VRGEDDDRQRRVALVDVLEQRHAVHCAHAQIGNHQLGGGRGQARQRALRAGCALDGIARAFQTERQKPQQVGIVVDDEYSCLCHVYLLFGGGAVCPRSIIFISKSRMAPSFCCAPHGLLCGRIQVNVAPASGCVTPAPGSSCGSLHLTGRQDHPQVCAGIAVVNDFCAPLVRRRIFAHDRQPSPVPFTGPVYSVLPW